MIRYDRSSGDGVSGPSLFAVAAFTDVDGNPGEASATSSGTNWPISHPVPVIQLPGAPSTARIDLSSQQRSSALLYTVVGAGFFDRA